MMKAMRKITCFVFVLVFISSFSYAENAGPVTEGLSLEQTLRMAYIGNPRMIEARKEISAAKGRWIQAEALPDPEAGIEVGGFKKNEDGVRKKNLDTVEVSQPLDPPGTRFLRARIAHDGVKIAKGELTSVWGEIRKQIIELYARIQAEEKAQEIARDNLNATRQFFTRVETRFQSGNALQSDVIRARIEVSRAENDLMVREKDLKVSKGTLNLAVGRDVEIAFTLSDPLAYEGLQYEYEKIKGLALTQRADVRNEGRNVS